jgi:hypothetical protein
MRHFRFTALAVLCAIAATTLGAQTTKTQSINGTLTDRWLACTATGGANNGSQAAQSYCRTYILTDPLVVTAIRFGVFVDGGPTTIDIRFWTFTGAPAFTTPVGVTNTFTTPGDGRWDESVAIVPLDTPVSLAAGEVLVEFGVQDNMAAGARFLLGWNNQGEISDSYWYAPSCGVIDVTAMSAVPTNPAGGFPDEHIILDLVGFEAPGAPPDPGIGVRFPTGAANEIGTGGTMHAGPFAPGAAANISIQVRNHGAANALTHSVGTSAATNCVLGTPTLAANTAALTNSTLTIPVTPAAGIGTFSFMVTITSNDPFQPTYSFTVNGGRGMSGTYTVDTVAANNPDYADIGDAFDDLESFGMVGPVVLEIAGGPYTTTFSYGLGSQLNGQHTPVRGNSLVNTITLRGIPVGTGAGSLPKIDGGAPTGSIIDPIGQTESGCMSICGVSGVTVEKLEFLNATGFGLWVVGQKIKGELAGTATVRACVFRDVTDGPGLAFVHDHGRYNQITVENCMAYNCGAGNSAYGAVFRGVISFFNAGADVLAQHNSVLHNRSSGTNPSGCFGFQGNNVTVPRPVKLNYNIMSTTVANRTIFTFSNTLFGSPDAQQPSEAIRNVYHTTNGAVVGLAIGNGTTIPQAVYTDLAAWQTAFGTLDVNSITGDPKFNSTIAGSSDLHLLGNSPAIDLATSSTLATDIDGQNRPMNSARDAGADERPGTGGGGGNSLAITSSGTLPNAAEQVQYTAYVNASATGLSNPFGWSISGQPAWLSIIGNTLTGRLSGNPPAGTGAGTYNFSVTVSHSGGLSDTRQMTLTVLPAGSLVITTTSLAAATANKAYSETIVCVNGTPGFTWSVSAGTLPAGLTLGSSTSSSVALSGSPTATGTFNFTIQVVDNAAAMASVDYTLKVSAAKPISVASGSSGGCSARDSGTWWLLAMLAAFSGGLALRRRRA